MRGRAWRPAAVALGSPIGVTLNIFDPAFLEDPYPFYAELRASGAAAQEAPHFWRLVGYADVAAVLRHAGVSSRRPAAAALFAEAPDDVRRAAASVDEHLASWLLMLDPPDHTRLRRLVQLAFTPRVVERVRSRVDELVRELLAEAGPGVELDLMETLAVPLPVRVIAELIGVPGEDAELLKRWSEDIGAIVGGAAASPERARLFVDAAASVAAFEAYLLDEIAARRRRPGDDLLSGLVAAEDDGSTLATAEVVGTVALLLSAGHETTTNLIGNGMLALLRHPDERRRLRGDNSLLPGAIEELLRFDSPVQATIRTMLAPFETSSGDVIQPGSVVGVWLGSANRDETVFPDADRLDVTRRGAKHLSFAHGPHYCLGAALARLEADVAFAHLLHRLPDAELVQEPVHRANPSLRGVTALELRFHHA